MTTRRARWGRLARRVLLGLLRLGACLVAAAVVAASILLAFHREIIETYVLPRAIEAAESELGLEVSLGDFDLDARGVVTLRRVEARGTEARALEDRGGE